MTVKSLENASFVQIKYDFSIRFLLLNEFTFVYYHMENYGFLYLAEVQLAEKSLCNNFGVDINLYQFFHFSARRNNSTGISWC